MRIEFQVTGSDRKALVTAMAEILGVKAKYMGMPSMNYEVDYFTVTKDGTVEFDDRADSEEIEQLLEGLADKGFVAAPAEMAETWLEKRATLELSDDEHAMFISLQKKRISTRAVEDLVKKFAIQASPLKKISPHKLRSTFGTNLYKQTKDIYIVADILGHKDVNTTKKHYAAIDEDMRKSVSKNVVVNSD